MSYRMLRVRRNFDTSDTVVAQWLQLLKLQRRIGNPLRLLRAEPQPLNQYISDALSQAWQQFPLTEVST